MPNFAVTAINPLPAGTPYVQLPGEPGAPGAQLLGGQTITVDSVIFDQIDPALFTTGGAGGGGVLSYTTVYEGLPTNLPALTSSQVNPATVTLSALATAYNQLQSDVAALRAAL